jgi:hypothetical protein
VALTVVQDAAPASTANTRTLSWTGTVAVGDVVVVTAETEDTAVTLGVPAGTGLTFTQRAAPTAATRTRPYIWTAVAASAGSVTVTSTVSASAIHNGVMYICPTADGYSLAGTPNVVSIASGGTTGSGSLTGTAGSLYLVCVADWNGVNGSARAWASSGVEDLYQFSATNSTQYNAHGTCTGTSTTVGLTAPTTGCQFSIAAIEILKSAGGGSTTLYHPRAMSVAPIIRANNI